MTVLLLEVRNDMLSGKQPPLGGTDVVKDVRPQAAVDGYKLREIVDFFLAHVPFDERDLNACKAHLQQLCPDLEGLTDGDLLQ